MAARKPKIKSRRNKSNGQWYTHLKAGNGEIEFPLGEGMYRKFSEADRQRLIKHLSEAEIEYDPAPKAKKKPMR